MMLYPAIDLKDGQCVQLVGGDPARQKLALPDPIEVAQKWEAEGAAALHVVDLDAALGTGDNREVIEDILRAVDLPLQVGGGVRHLTEIQQFLDSGIGRVVVGTQGIQQPLWLKEAVNLFPGKLVLAVDARGDEVQVKGWTEGAGLTVQKVLADVANLPLAGVLYTNVDVEGQMQGIREEPVRRVLAASKHPVVVSGGITTLEDLLTLSRLGADSAVLGMALYTGRIDFRGALEAVSSPEERARAVQGKYRRFQWKQDEAGVKVRHVAAANGHDHGEDEGEGHEDEGQEES